MTRLLASLAALALLAACGIDGTPQRPADAPRPGITIAGDAEISIMGDV